MTKGSHDRDVPPTVMQVLAEEGCTDHRFTRVSLAIAVVAHLVFFAVQWPSFAREATADNENKPKIFVIQQVKFEPPPKVQVNIRPPRAVRVPIPDPFPDDPEPLRDEVIEEVDYIEDENLIVAEIAAPPPPPPQGPRRYVIGGDITAPVKLSGPTPLYTPAANRARIQGTVILDCVIDRDGNVSEITVLKGLSLGLTESAVEAVKRWRFEAATLQGKPIAVQYILTITFTQTRP